MATVTGLTAARMEAIEAATVVGGHIDEEGHLILEKFDESEVDAGSVNGAIPDATTSVKGIVELATDEEAITGTDTERAVTPHALAEAMDDAIGAALSTFLQAVYPVGAYYVSGGSTSPATLFGFGTWTARQGRVLIGQDTDFSAGSTGGAQTHTIGSANLPTHTHGAGTLANSTTGAHTHTVPNVITPSGSGSGAFFESWPGGTGSRTHSTSSDGNHTHTISGNTGDGGFANTAINHMPPWRGVYMWERTA